MVQSDKCITLSGEAMLNNRRANSLDVVWCGNGQTIKYLNTGS